MFSWFAIGAAIENAALAATRHNLRPQVEYILPPQERHDTEELVARLRLHPDGQPDPLADQIAPRHTNRKPYRKNALATTTLDRLTEAAGGLCRCDWITDRVAIAQMAKLVVSADRIRFETPTFHEELFEVLRFSRDEAQRTRDGLDMRTLELPRPAWPLIRWLRSWPRMRLMNRFGASRVFAGMSAVQVKASGALVMLSVSEPSDEGFLECGRGMQRLWLAATAEGLAVQPLGGLSLFLMKLAHEPDTLLAEHRRWLTDIRRGIEALFPAMRPHTPAMLLRLGQATPPKARSLRYDEPRVILS
jgi:hypothetical protein